LNIAEAADFEPNIGRKGSVDRAIFMAYSFLRTKRYMARSIPSQIAKVTAVHVQTVLLGDPAKPTIRRGENLAA
jgi:hypothetical protein